MLQHGGHDRRARGAITFAEQVLGRVEPAVAAQKLGDEAGEGPGVGIGAVELVRRVLAGDAAEAGAGRVDEHEVGRVQQAVVVVHQPVRCRVGVGVVGGDDPPGPERAHVQPDRGGARTAVVDKGDGPVLRPRALLQVGDIEHRRFRGGVLGVAGAVGRVGVVPALRVDHQGAGTRLVVDLLPAHRDGAVRQLLLRQEVRQVLVVGRRVVGPNGRDGEKRQERGQDRAAQQKGSGQADAPKKGPGMYSPGPSSGRETEGLQRAQRWNTTFTQLSALSRNVLYSSGPSSRLLDRCVIRKVGSMLPSWISLASGSR